MGGYDIIFRKDFVGLKSAIRKELGINPNSIHLKYSNSQPDSDLYVFVPKVRSRDIESIASKFHFYVCGPESIDAIGTLLGYENKDNEDYNELTGKGIKIGYDGFAYQPQATEPEDPYEWDEEYGY